MVFCNAVSVSQKPWYKNINAEGYDIMDYDGKCIIINIIHRIPFVLVYDKTGGKFIWNIGFFPELLQHN